MQGKTGATDTQKNILVSLHDGWRLQLVDGRGWYLFQPTLPAPFARVKTNTIERMTISGWLSHGAPSQTIHDRPAKELTVLGRRYAKTLKDRSAGHLQFPGGSDDRLSEAA